MTQQTATERLQAWMDSPRYTPWPVGAFCAVLEQRADLLEALKDAEAALSQYARRQDPLWDGSATPSSAIGRARAAIAKAEGA